MTEFVPALRRQKSAAFDLAANSTAGRTVPIEFWGRRAAVYANANLSIYSGQTCNARCRFCVEELRPASRGGDVLRDKAVERDDDAYFARLREVLEVVRPLDPTVSITGGEPSWDPRLPRVLAAVAGGRRLTLTTNGAGLLDERDGRRVIDAIVAAGARHLNISRAHADCVRNAQLMRMSDGLALAELREVIASAHDAGTRVRLSCVLLRGAVDSLDSVLDYLRFARSLGVDNVIFRQLMGTDPGTAHGPVVRYSDEARVVLEPLLDQLSSRMQFQRQIVGYYYYVEVWRWEGIDVVLEEADLARLEATKGDAVVHELVFHPNGRLASTWQPWDGVLGP